MTELPFFIKDLPVVDIGVPEITVYIMVGAQTVALIEVSDDATVKPHSHGPQWGIVLAGQVGLSMAGAAHIFRRGDTYLIPAGVEHGATLTKGTRLVEFFAENDRFDL
jgi:quercetin dioxygenase-like cupin family protein